MYNTTIPITVHPDPRARHYHANLELFLLVDAGTESPTYPKNN